MCEPVHTQIWVKLQDTCNMYVAYTDQRQIWCARLQGDLPRAIETYHKALAYKADCSVTQALLGEALEEHCHFCCQHDDPGLM